MVVTLGESAPDIDKPEKWFKMAWEVACNQDANEAFLEANQNAVKTNPQTSFAAPKLATPLSFPFTFSPCLLRAKVQSMAMPGPAAFKNGPAPMDVNRAKSRSDYPVVCCCCHKTGHYTLEFPQAYDIWTMTAEEKLEFLSKLLVLEDGSEALHVETEPEVTGGPRLEEEMPEDLGAAVGEMCTTTACT